MNSLRIYVCVEWDGDGRFFTTVVWCCYSMNRNEKWSFVVIFNVFEICVCRFSNEYSIFSSNNSNIWCNFFLTSCSLVGYLNRKFKMIKYQTYNNNRVPNNCTYILSIQYMTLLSNVYQEWGSHYLYIRTHYTIYDTSIKRTKRKEFSTVMSTIYLILYLPNSNL